MTGSCSKSTSWKSNAIRVFGSADRSHWEPRRVRWMQNWDSVADFVRRQNINRYRRLLQTHLDVDRRRAVLDLLAQEEAAEREVAGADGHSADELPKLLRVLGVDPQKLAFEEPGIMQSLRGICVICRHKDQCRHDLAARRAASRYRDYCPNSMSLEALLQEQRII